MTFYRIIKEKFEEKERMLSMEGREELDAEAVIGRALGGVGGGREGPIRRMHM